MNKTIEALNNLENGNISDFKEWLKKTSKTEMLLAISNYAATHNNNHEHIITRMWSYLKRD